MPIYSSGTIANPLLAWSTGKTYYVGDDVVESNKIYTCIVEHTGGTFADDLAASKWAELSTAIAYTAGDGLDLTGTAFSIDAKANGGLVIDSTELTVDLAASGITGTLALGDGGTGQTTAQAAIDALTAVSGATTGHVLTKDGSGNATWAAAAAGATDLDGLSDAQSTAQDLTLGQGAGNDMDTSTPTYNTYVGVNAGYDSDTDTRFNVAIGHSAMENNEAGDNQVAIGYQALSQGTTGTMSNTAIGWRALAGSTGGTGNVALGYETLRTAGSIGDYNVAIGYQAMTTFYNSQYTIAIGYKAGYANRDDYSVLIGHQVAYGSSQVGASNVYIGDQAAYKSTTASKNVAIGYKAAYDITIGADNVILGNLAAENITEGEDNIVLGTSAADNLTTGDNNIIIGNAVDASSATVSNELRIGSGAVLPLSANLSTGAVTINSAYTLPTAVTGANNYVLTAQTDGSTAWAAVSGGASDLNGLDDVSVLGSGYAWSLFKNGTSPNGAAVTGTFSGERNLGIGAGALNSITSGHDNIAIGYWAGNALTTESDNILIGWGAGKLLSSGAHSNTVLGFGALDAATTGYGNTVMGHNAASAVTLGDFNVCIGSMAGNALQNADRNVIIGYDSDGAANADHQIAIGDKVVSTQASSFILGQDGQILLHGDFATAGETKLGVNLGNTWTAPTANLHVKGQGTGTDTALLVEDSAGDDLLKVLDNGSVTVNNAYTLPTAVTAANDYVLTAQTDGSTAWAAVSGGGGASALNDLSDATTPSPGNVGIGSNALSSIASGGNYNTAVGEDAGKAVATGKYNCYFGFQAGETKTGSRNIAIGYKAFEAGSASGNDTVTIGYSAMQTATGSGNTAIGRSSGDGLSSGSNNTFLGYLTDGVNTNHNQIAIGYNATAGGTNTIQMGNSSITTADIQVSWTVASDERVKDNITDTAIGLDFINALRPVTFTKIHPADYPTEIREDRYKQGGADYDEETETPIKGEFDTTTAHDGLIAQEVKAAMDSLGVDFSGWKEKADGRQGIQYEALVMPLIKAVQELSAKVKELENK